MDVCLNLRCVFLLFFLVEVCRNPPMTAQPKPKNISWACHCTAVNEAAGDGMTPEKTNTQRSGRLNPDKQANMKNGRKPTSQSGYADSFILPPVYPFAWTASNCTVGQCVVELVEAFGLFPLLLKPIVFQCCATVSLSSLTIIMAMPNQRGEQQGNIRESGHPVPSCLHGGVSANKLCLDTMALT